MLARSTFVVCADGQRGGGTGAEGAHVGGAGAVDDVVALVLKGAVVAVLGAARHRVCLEGGFNRVRVLALLMGWRVVETGAASASYVESLHQ